MKTSIKTLRIVCAFAVMQLIPASISALDNASDIIKLDETQLIRQDMVKADLATVAGKKDKEFFFRNVSIAANGSYEVVIKDKNDRMRMTGSYADVDLQQAQGEFTYYYPNGNVESTGLYVNGAKSGTWLRYHSDGSPRAERNYTGMTWEDMAVSLGMASKAGSH